MNYGDVALTILIALVAGYVGGWAAMRSIFHIVKRAEEIERRGGG
jgi:hypothetical protein